MNKPHVLQISLTYNRATLLERALYCFLNQDYDGPATLLIFNTGDRTELGHFDIPHNRYIVLINSDKEYKSVGEKYLDSMQYWPDSDIICICDDDDMTLPNYISEGVKGLIKGAKKAYKPEYSFYHQGGQIHRVSNTHEGSIFMKASHLKEHGFHSEYSVKYHDKWLIPLITENEIFVDLDGIASWLYDWFNPIPVYKMSGRQESQENYQVSQLEAKDKGTGILTPNPHNYQEIKSKCESL